MSRARRFTYRGALHHVTMRCNNKEFLFDDQSRLLFLDVLRETCAKFDVRLYNYCLMTNHIHLLFDVWGDDVLSPLMQRQANVFARRFNTLRERKGHLWEARFRSTIVEAPAYFLRSMAYIDLNPVRARMAAGPGEYRWSGHTALLAEDTSLITLHRLYLGLGKDRASRRRAYLRILRDEARRAPYSLAGALFVGGRYFVCRMQKRFGVGDGRASRVEFVSLGQEVEAVELRRSRRPRRRS